MTVSLRSNNPPLFDSPVALVISTTDVSNAYDVLLSLKKAQTPMSYVPLLEYVCCTEPSVLSITLPSPNEKRYNFAPGA